MKILIFLFIFFISFNLSAQTIGLTIKATNVYAEPSFQSEIIDRVEKNTVMLLGELADVFVRVTYLNTRGELKNGWVRYANIKIHNQQSTSSSSGSCHDIYTTYNGANFCLYVDNVRFDCDESYYDNSYDSCDVNIDLSYTSDYNGNDSPQVNITCEAKLETTDDSRWTSTERDSEYIYAYGKDGWESVKINIDVGSYYSKIIKVSLEDVDCYIEDVY